MKINKLFMILVIAIGCSNAEASTENREMPSLMTTFVKYVGCTSALSTGLCVLRAALLEPDSKNPRNEVDATDVAIMFGTNAAVLTVLIYRHYNSQQRPTDRDPEA